MNDESEIAGVTINERLYHFRLFETFDAAVLSGELARVIAVLRQARFTDAQAHQTASAVLAFPARYGFPSRAGA